MHYKQGDHVCTLYSTREEQLAAAIEYIRGGLSRGERCLYVCCEHTPDEFREGLKNAGIDVDAEEARGALILITKREGHLSGGCFDPDKMISMLHTAVKEALDAGFAGLCAAGDMSWLLDEAPGSDRIAEYEARLNAFYPSQRALGLCLYNRNRLPKEMLDHGLATHPHVRIAGNILLDNPFYEHPEIAASRGADARKAVKKIEWLDRLIAAFV
ncbi:MAG TPA: MEDS domain-containing protein [Thermoanaerobaculia bacterium]|nr:MEDS domain-containing protein [Thermoanaerobaculia bacterium]